jgi:hypothetical protein
MTDILTEIGALTLLGDNTPASAVAALRQIGKMVAAEQLKVAGNWPPHCEQRAFVEGAKWHLFESIGATMFPTERDEAEAEAIRRYGEPKTTGEVTRFEVLDETGRVLTRRPCSVALSFQDDGQTLKVFVTKK